MGDLGNEKQAFARRPLAKYLVDYSYDKIINLNIKGFQEAI